MVKGDSGKAGVLGCMEREGTYTSTVGGEKKQAQSTRRDTPVFEWDSNNLRRSEADNDKI